MGQEEEVEQGKGKGEASEPGPLRQDHLRALPERRAQAEAHHPLDNLGEAQGSDIVDGLVVKHDSNVGVLEERVGGEHGVVWLNNGGGHLWGWVHTESELGLLAVIDREALEEEGSET